MSQLNQDPAQTTEKTYPLSEEGQQLLSQGLRIVYPEYGYTSPAASTFLMGHWSGDGALWIKGQEVLLSPQRFFAHPVALEPGENHVALFRRADGADDQDMPLGIWQVHCEVPEVEEPFIPVGPQCNIESLDPYPARIVAEPESPPWNEGVITRVHPQDGPRLSPLPLGTGLWITGRWNDWCRFDRGAGQWGWIHQDAIEPDEQVLPVGANALLGFKQQPVPGSEVDTVGWTLEFNDTVPMNCATSEDGVVFTLSGCISRCHTLPVGNQHAGVGSIQMEDTGQGQVRLMIRTVRPLAGVDYWWDKSSQDGDASPSRSILHLRLWTLPAHLKDLRVMIDPGHGGDERGGVALDGTPEKKLNMLLAQGLGQALKDCGIRVGLTRISDETVPLAQRLFRARYAFGEDIRPHLVLSIHHNALPDDKHPWEYEGTSTHSYMGHGMAYGHRFHQELMRGLGRRFPDDGVQFNSLWMTRISWAVALLLERDYMTHPVRCESILDPTAQQGWINAVTDAVIAMVVHRSA